MSIYVLMNNGGQYYDFFDGTWNDHLTDCWAPFITLETIGKLKDAMPTLYNTATALYVGRL